MWHQGERDVCSVGAGSDILLSVLVWQCHCSMTLTRVPVLHSSEVLNLQWFGGSVIAVKKGEKPGLLTAQEIWLNRR